MQEATRTMARTGHKGLRCGSTACEGHVERIAQGPSDPDFWVRVDDDGRWACSNEPPHANELAQPAGYRCGLCRKTFRIVRTRRDRELVS